MIAESSNRTGSTLMPSLPTQPYAAPGAEESWEPKKGGEGCLSRQRYTAIMLRHTTASFLEQRMGSKGTSIYRFRVINDLMDAEC